MKYTLLLQASQIKLITLRLTELLVIVWLIFWTGNYIKHWRDMYRCITMSHFIPRVVLLFCSTLVSLWLTPLWFSLLWSLLMSDVVPYLDEAMQWATDAVIDCHFFFQNNTRRECSCHENTFLLYTTFREKVPLPCTFF